MKHLLYIILFTLVIFACSKSDDTNNSENIDKFQNGEAGKTEADSVVVKYRKAYMEAPRNANYLWAMTGYCKQSKDSGFDEGYVLDSRSSTANKYSYDELAISIQTSNLPLDRSDNTFNLRPQCFKYGEFSHTLTDYLDEGSDAYSQVLDSVFYKEVYRPNATGDGGPTTMGTFYEYRTTIVKDITITANVPLFNREPGTDISDKFKIVLFYMNAMACPSYIISSETSEVAYVIRKDGIYHISDNGGSRIPPIKLYGKTYEPYRNADINLKEWAQGKYYADPALYVQFTEKPSELPCKAIFTVTLFTADNELTASTVEVELL